MSNNFYIDIKNNSKTDYWIKWKLNQFAANKSGYIIQHMNIESHIDCVKESNYWEAWKVIDGKIFPDDCVYDDNWSPIPDFLIPMCIDSINESKDGIIIYKSDVYFIPMESVLYGLIEAWDVVSGSPANELQMTYRFEADVSDYYIGSRSYVWDYKKMI